MQACVRATDYDQAETIFSDDVVAFGTFEGMVKGRPALRAAQWTSWKKPGTISFFSA